MFCTAVSTSLSGVWGQQLLPRCIRAKACQPALPAHSKGQSVSGGAPVGGCKVRLVGGWPGWSFLTRGPASQQDQTGCRVNHYPSHYLTVSSQPLIPFLQLNTAVSPDHCICQWTGEETFINFTKRMLLGLGLGVCVIYRAVLNMHQCYWKIQYQQSA